jgi:hypothetical protein
VGEAHALTDRAKQLGTLPHHGQAGRHVAVGDASPAALHQAERGEERVRVVAAQCQQLLGQGRDGGGVVTLLVNLAGQEQRQRQAERMPDLARELHHVVGAGGGIIQIADHG